MKVIVKVGRTEGFVSSYNLIFPDGLRLKTNSLTWFPASEKQKIHDRFLALLNSFHSAGWTVEGTIDE